MKNSPTQELHATVAETQAQLREGDFRYRERKSLAPPTEFSAWHDRFFCLPLQEMHTHAC